MLRFLIHVITFTYRFMGMILALFCPHTKQFYSYFECVEETWPLRKQATCALQGSARGNFFMYGR